ncbi:MAG TPA: dTDP-4-dehydrorhamnose reductase [Thermoanaerobaculia bacterium]|nr:dTDP-4-dehydrorhamnose reductase [Thermoanaerobaculia bacterium]
MQTVILGAGGMLGRALGREFPAAERFTRAALDITDVPAVHAAVQPGVRLVLNAAADTRVDAAETDPRHNRVNHVAVGLLAARCSEIGATLVHVSTDYVFSGRSIRPYREDDPVDPVNAYGRGKLAGERRAFEEGDEVLVVRTSWVFGTGGSNFVDTILKRVEAGSRELSIVDDQVGRPTYAGDLAAAIRSLIDRRVTGIVHFANGGDATWHDLAREALRLSGREDVLLRAVKTEEFPRPARRPKHSVLDTSLYERLTKVTPRPWPQALAAYLEERRAVVSPAPFP